jgi:probable phosphoglycerate mutase
MHLTLIRHARSNHNQNGMISGLKSCTGLSPEGLSQAERLAERFRATGEAIDCRVLLSSPVRRAWQTAGLIAQALPAAAPIADPDLVELIPGDSDGLSYQAFKARYGDFNPQQEPDRPFPSNGETWNCFVDRVQTTLNRIATQNPDRHVIAVTHAGFIVVAFMVLFGLRDSASRAWIDPANTAITEWSCEGGQWILIKYNDDWHLNGSRQEACTPMTVAADLQSPAKFLS